MLKIRMTWFDLLGSLYLKSNGGIWKSMHDFLFNFNSKHEAKCHRLEDIAFENTWPNGHIGHR